MIGIALRPVCKSRTILRSLRGAQCPNASIQVMHRKPYLPHNFSRNITVRRVVSGNPKVPKIPRPPKNKEAVKRPSKVPELLRESGESFGHIDPDRWLSELPLPSAAYWDQWYRITGDDKRDDRALAKKLLFRWQDGIQSYFRSEKLPDGWIFQHTAQYELPLIGTRKAVGYGHNQASARKNSLAALASALYQTRELDIVMKGSLYSRRLLDIFVKSSHHAFYPQFSVSRKPTREPAKGEDLISVPHSFTIEMSIPHWDIHVVVSAPTYIEALAEAVKIFERKTRNLGDKWSKPEPHNEKLQVLQLNTIGKFVKFAAEKLDLRRFWSTYAKVNMPGGPQNMYKVHHHKHRYSAHISMLRTVDARRMGMLTAAVRILQNHGLETIDGFKEALETDELKGRAVRESEGGQDNDEEAE